MLYVFMVIIALGLSCILFDIFYLIFFIGAIKCVYNFNLQVKVVKRLKNWPIVSLNKVPTNILLAKHHSTSGRPAKTSYGLNRETEPCVYDYLCLTAVCRDSDG